MGITNNQNPRVSVIIPIYGVEKYITRCVRSLFSQTYANIEFIFIDDCTFDLSIDLLQNEINAYSSIIKEKGWKVRLERMSHNSGLPAVRMYGINLASGKYISHVDSDDWVEPHMLESLVLEAERGSFDIVFCNYYKDCGTHRSIESRFNSFNSNSLIIMKRLMMAEELGPVWGAIYRKEIYEKPYIQPPSNMGEDLTFNIQWLYYCKRSIGWVRKPLYHYFYNIQSISRDESSANIERKFYQLNKNVDTLYEFFCRENIYENYKSGLISLRLWACRTLTPLLGNKKYYKYWREKVDEINGSILRNPDLPKYVKYHYILSWLRLMPILSKIKSLIIQ